MAKNRKRQISRRRLGHMVMERQSLATQLKHLRGLQKKLKDGTATVVVNPDGTKTIITVPYRDLNLKKKSDGDND